MKCLGAKEYLIHNGQKLCVCVCVFYWVGHKFASNMEKLEQTFWLTQYLHTRREKQQNTEHILKC